MSYLEANISNSIYWYCYFGIRFSESSFDLISIIRHLVNCFISIPYVKYCCTLDVRECLQISIWTRIRETIAKCNLIGN